MARIDNVEVFGLASSIFRSGYPMMDHAPTRDEFKAAVEEIETAIMTGDFNNPHIKRAVKLAQAKGGGHDQFLTGIVVNFDLTLTNKAWVEAERYKFLNFISSMSTMHRASVLPIKDQCNAHVLPAISDLVEDLQTAYNAIDGEKYPEQKRQAYLDLLYNIPSGFELTAGMTTNYRCCKNMYAQRKDHRLPDWREGVCPWIETLPMATYLITGEDKV